MNNLKTLLVGTGIFTIFSIVVALIYFNMFKVTAPITSNSVFDDNDIYSLEATYTGSNSWTYKVTAQLPNPCYGAAVEARVAESYPEQVTILVTPAFPKPDQYCIEMIQDFSYTGTFSASEKAQISLKVANTR